MPEITPKNNFPREREKINFKAQWFCGKTGKISSSVSFHQNFWVFHTKFNIRFRRLVLLEMNCFEKIIKRALQKFAIQCKESWYKVFVHLLLQRLADSVLICFGCDVSSEQKIFTYFGVLHYFVSFKGAELQFSQILIGIRAQLLDPIKWN